MQGLFVASFVTSLGGGSVALFACDGEVFGGDAHFCFSGKLRKTGKFIAARIRVRRHTEGRSSVFGDLTDYELNLTGPLPGTRLAGTSPEAPGVSITMILERAPLGDDRKAWRRFLDGFLPAPRAKGRSSAHP